MSVPTGVDLAPSISQSAMSLMSMPIAARSAPTI
jgi:hypothetical protein